MSERIMPGDEQRAVDEAEAIIRDAQSPGLGQKIKSLKYKYEIPPSLILKKIKEINNDRIHQINKQFSRNL